MAIKKVARKPKILPAKDIAVTPVENTTLTNRLKQPKIFIPLIVIILIVLAFVFKGVFVAALVNGQPISRLSLIKELEKQGGKQTLASLINQTLILQEAKKKNINISEKEVNEEVKKIEEDLKKQGQNLDTALLTQGMTRGDLIAQLKIRKLVEKLLADQIKVTDKEVADYVEKNKETFPENISDKEI